jgi:predicted metallopeptidase
MERDGEEQKAVNSYEDTMKEFDTDRDENQRGDCAYSSKETFGKKTVYIPCAEHRARKLFERALMERTEKATFIDECNLSIQLTLVYPVITKKTIARFVKGNRLLKQLSGFDYVCEFSGVAFDKLTDEQIMRVYHHELEHLGFKEKSDGTIAHGLIDHDLLDFHSIIDQYGLHWVPVGLLEED